MKTKRAKTIPYHHGDLQNTLIAATLELITEQGGDAFTIREVARRAGVSHTAPYRHFTDKAALLATVAKQGFDMLVEHMRKRIAGYPDDPLLRFKYCGVAYIEFAVDHPAHYRVMFGPDKAKSRETAAVRKSAETAFQTLLDCIEACQASGTIRPGNTMEMALSAWSIVHGFSMLFIDHYIKEARTPGQDLAGMMSIVTESLYFGLRAG